MNESAARTVLWVRAVEEADSQAQVLSRPERAEATRWALDEEISRQPPLGDCDSSVLSTAQERYLLKRAIRLAERLSQAQPLARTIRDEIGWRGGVTVSLALGSIGLGLAANVLGPEKRVNIIAIPLLGMLIWNLAVYLALMFKQLWGPSGAMRIGSGLTRAITALALRRRGPDSLARSEDPAVRVLQRSRAAFVEEWIRCGAPLHLTRASRLLHLCAALLAVGMVGGMYWRGLGFEYRAGWESTFLNERMVERILHFTLGPASALSGINLPSAEQLAGMRWPDSPGIPAAPWIHLYATTAALFIVVPRIALALTSARRERRFRESFPLPGLEDEYFRRTVSAKPGRGDHVRVVPCGFRPNRASQEVLRGLLAELLGLSVNVEYVNMIGYGDEETYLESAAAGEACDYLALLFNLASTPEEESHGRLIAGLAGLSNQGRGARHLLLLLEESAYRQRLAVHSTDRLEERRKAWKRLAAAHGMELASVDLELSDPGRWAEEHRRLVEEGRDADA